MLEVTTGVFKLTRLHTVSASANSVCLVLSSVHGELLRNLQSKRISNSAQNGPTISTRSFGAYHPGKKSSKKRTKTSIKSIIWYINEDYDLCDEEW